MKSVFTEYYTTHSTHCLHVWPPCWCWVRVAQSVVFMVHFADLLWLLWHIMEFSETMQMGQLFAVLCEHGYKLPHFTPLLCGPNLGCSEMHCPQVPRMKLDPGLLSVKEHRNKIFDIYIYKYLLLELRVSQLI